MSKQIYVNLPVKDLKVAREFYTKVGFKVNEDFSNEQAIAVYLDDLYFMLLTEDFYREASKREIADATKVSEVLVAISVDSKEEVDALLDAAHAAGAEKDPEVMAEEGIYSRSFCDPFGHQFNILHMSF
jgi:predicted lactoylglutathione lyase